MRTFYDVLGVRPGAATDEIRQAYRRLVRSCHPDIAGDDGASRFREVREAYETLTDSNRRREYDATLWRPRHLGTAVPLTVTPDWTRDEIAIDFPSVADAIARMRDAFLADDEGAVPLSAEVELSPREACCGVRVPLDVPVRRTCPRCGGRGESWMERCAVCEGSGEALLQHRVTLSVPAGVPHGARFRFTVGSALSPPTHVEVRVAIR